MNALNAPTDPAAAHPVGTTAPVGTQPPRALDKIWAAASASQLTIALAVLLAFTLAVAALLPQLPGGLDALSASRWLSTVAARYGRFGPFLSSSGLLDVLRGPWIVALLALTAFHLLLRCVNQLRHLVAARVGMPLAPQGLPFEIVSVLAPVSALEPQLDALLASGRHGVCSCTGEEVVRPRMDAYTERRSWAAAGSLLTYAGPLLIILGLLWNTVYGWRAADVPLTPGRTVQPTQARGLALNLVNPGAPGGNPPAVISLTQGAETRNAWLGYARPAVWGAVWVSQRSSGPALEVRAASGGQPLALQSLQDAAVPLPSPSEGSESLHLRFGQNESEQGFTIPGRDLAFRVVSYENLAERSLDRPVFLVEGYQGADPAPALNQLVEDQGVIDWQGVTLTLQREAHVVVDLAAMPGLPVLVLGGLVLLLGAAVVAWGGLTRIWVNAAAERGGTLVGVRVAAPAMGQAEVVRIARLLAGADAALPANPTFAGDAFQPARKWRLAREQWLRVVFALAAALLLAGIAWTVVRTVGPAAPQAKTWLFFVHLGFAALGLGAFVLAAAESLGFAVRSSRPTEVLDPTFPAERQAMRGRAGDPGRLAALLAFPLLTIAVLSGSAWGLFSFAAPVRTAAAEMWLLVAWLLGTAYCHATSGWRPLHVPAWLAALLILAAAAAGFAAGLASSSLLTV